MNYGKNQLALLKFLEKYPNRWHRIKRRKAIDAARRLERRSIGVSLVEILAKGTFHVAIFFPQMLIKQN